MIGQNSGVEGQTLEQVYAAFEEGAGVEVRYTGTPDQTAIVQSRIQAGNPPDVADLQLGMAQDFAEQGLLDDLSAAFGDELTANFSEMLLGTATHDGKVIGVYQGMNPFMVWYNPKSYTGPEAPQDWKALADWTGQEAAAGRTAWCAAQGAGASSGFPGAQMIENIFLKKYGPDLYRQWGAGELPWTSDQVRDAFEEFGRVIAADGHVQGGAIGAISTPISTGYNGLTSDPAGCSLVMWGAWVPGLIGDTAKSGENIDFFRVPAATPEDYGYELFQSALAVGFTDRPETKAFLEFMASTPAQTYFASLNRWPVANKNVPVDTYPSPLLQKIATEFLGSGDVQFAAGPNLMASAATGTAFYRGVVGYMQDPSSLNRVLETIQATVQ
ncbi:Alpha-glucosides-binding protein periplasmic protein AglE precursor [Rubellimicrobium mesophilum DSM 19309]|uniref:Alpha-glucosides-binding protein periplasmic protein AglE n=1 Tax=Rubellimicrobium mesophilum DSM 19309 TaxID=442562 RepID=A0A017HKH5_9RHOB|nr:extracellular solute-binding protein [Rubellimicrobium mesophilum]EYD74279.1 Alpha-glucosides-binding protein periplasmic protein AglE precursor [Rubellimicrobium mesophilum DSM 19309]